jgi:hypothetical protein
MFGLSETFLQVAFVEDLIGTYRWVWPLAEVLHFLGLILLVGIVAMLDLRMLGVARRIPAAPLNRLMPWAVLGFCLCVLTGMLFVTGLWANVKMHPLEALRYDQFLQAKLLFIVLAGLNLVIYYAGGIARTVEGLGAGDLAPPAARFIGGASLALWVGVVYWGRLIPWGL